jgi:hypothetical protein
MFIYNVLIKIALSITEKVVQEKAIVNLSIFFFVSLYSYVLFTILQNNNKIITKQEKKYLKVIAIYWGLLIVLNLLCINQSWSFYNSITVNYVIDILLGGLLLCILILRLCLR